METITIFVCGGSRGNPGPAAIVVYIVNENKKVLGEVSESIGNATDSFASYQAVLRGLQMATDIFGNRTKEIQFEIMLTDKTIKEQLNNESEIKNPGLVPYFIEIHNMRVTGFLKLTFTLMKQKASKDLSMIVNQVLDA